MTEDDPGRFNENIFERQCREIYWQLKETGLEESESWAEARLILAQVTGLKQAQQLVSDITEFNPLWLEEIRRIISHRRERRPLAYSLGEIEFAGLSYRIIPGVLIPRVDTEALIEAVVEWAENLTKTGATKDSNAGSSDKGNDIPALNIAEIGVGSGIIAISLLKRLPNCKVWGCDISEAAIAITLGNARKHGVHERLTVVHGDWKKTLPNNFDVIVSNPPYIPIDLAPPGLYPIAEPGKLDPFGNFKHMVATKKELQPELRYEPKEALFAGKDGLDFYRDFAKKLPEHFSDPQKKQLFAAFEIGDNQEEQVLTIFKEKHWQNLEIKKDINGLPRVITANPPQSVSPPQG